VVLSDVDEEVSLEADEVECSEDDGDLEVLDTREDDVREADEADGGCEEALLSVWEVVAELLSGLDVDVCSLVESAVVDGVGLALVAEDCASSWILEKVSLLFPAADTAAATSPPPPPKIPPSPPRKPKESLIDDLIEFTVSLETSGAT
jgi:hypothetical protein